MPDFTHFPAEPVDLPLLPLRDVVVFPHMVIPLFVGRTKSIHALEAAMEGNKAIMLAAQKSAAQEEPTVSDMHGTGCIASILQLLKLPDNTVKVLVEGRQRASVQAVIDNEKYFSATVLPQPASDPLSAKEQDELEALRRAVMQSFEQYVKLNKKIPSEILLSITSIEDAGRLVDTISAHLPLELGYKQQILDEMNVHKRLELLFAKVKELCKSAVEG